MTINKFLENPNSQKNVIVELAIGQEQNTWYNYCAAVWQYVLTVNYTNTIHNFGYGAFGFGTFGTGGASNLGHNSILYTVTSVKVDGTEYTSTTLNNTIAGTEKFYFEAGNNQQGGLLYIHFTSHKQYWEFTNISIGLTHYVGNTYQYLSGSSYVAIEPRLKNAGSISQQKDHLFYGVMRLNSGELVIDNSDGYYDGWGDRDLFGHRINIKFGGNEVDYANYQNIFTGFINRIQQDYDNFSISLIDRRKFFEKNIGTNTLNIVDYPLMNVNNNLKTIPVCYGQVDYLEVVCINEEETPTPLNYRFVVADITNHSIKALSDVYVNHVSIYPISVPLLGYDLTNNVAYFDLAVSSGKYTKGDAVTVSLYGADDSAGRDGSGTYYSNSLDIISDVINTYLGDSLSITNYNLVHWNSIKSQTYAAWYVFKKTTIETFIQDIAFSNYGNFVIDSNGLYDFIRFQTLSASVKTIYQDEILNWTGFIYDPETVLSKIIIKTKYADGAEIIRYIDITNQDSVYQKYQKYIEKEFPTNIISYANSVLYANYIATLTDKIYPEFTVTTKTQNIDLEVGDIISIELNRINKTMFGTVRAEVLGLTKNLDNFTVEIKAKYFENDNSVYYDWILSDDGTMGNIGYWATLGDSGADNDLGLDLIGVN